MMTVLVSGCAGFVETHFYDSLVADSLQTDSRENIQHLIRNDCFCFMTQDIELSLGAIMHVDRNCGLACPAISAHYQIDPVRTMRTNVTGARSILEVARRTQARVPHAPTSEVYGEPDADPWREDDRGCIASFGPRACYVEGKHAGEMVNSKTFRRSKLVCRPLPPDDPTWRCPDISLVQAELGGGSTVPLRDLLGRKSNHFNTMRRCKIAVSKGPARVRPLSEAVHPYRPTSSVKTLSALA